MPTMSDVQSVAANTRTANILAGKAFEFASRPSIVRFYIVAGAVGVRADILIGGESIMSDEEVSGANRYPQVNTDLTAQHGASGGDRLFLALRNTTGVAITVQTLVEVLPL